MAPVSSKENVADMKKQKLQYEEDDDEDLFEIDLEAVGDLPLPYYWESCLAVTANNLFAKCLVPIADVSSANTLFANCLVPITDVSSAVPMANPKDGKHTGMGSGSRRVVWVRGAEPFRTFAGSAGDLSNLLQKTLDVSASFDHGK